MNGRRAALSPIKTEIRNEKVLNTGGIRQPTGTPTDSQYSPIVRNQLITPPMSSGYGNAMNGYGIMHGPSSQRPESGRTSNGPSPPASIARSSNGASLYHGSTMYGSEVGSNRRVARDDRDFEVILSEHYMALKRYLASSLRDEKGNPRPNKARDKLLRLSAVQFQELSTDVFDELLRRQEAGRRVQDNESTPPPFLLPKETFHPKRNQARQKLSTLPPPRFRDLATDVFYELERRFPRFVEDNMNYSETSGFGGPVRIGTPTDPGMRPGSRAAGTGLRDDRIRRPSVASSVGSSVGLMHHSRQGGSRNLPNGGGLGAPPSPGSAVNVYGRPLPKTMQSNTIIPQKSTMIEDSDAADDDEEEDAFALEKMTHTRGGSNGHDAQPSAAADQTATVSYESQMVEMQEKIKDLEEALKRKDDALNESLELERQRSTIASTKEQEMSGLREKLEAQYLEATTLNTAIQAELDRVRTEKTETERNLRSQLEDLHISNNNSRNPADNDLQQENDELRRDLQEQQEISEEVRREAEEFLREMKMLTERSGSSWEREEQLNQQVAQLEQEVRVWKDRYTRTKTQLRNLRASSIGLSIENAGSYTQDSSFRQDDGLVKDVHVTKFQIAIDELLRVSRDDATDRVIEYMKNVVVAVRNITQDMDAPSSTPLSTQQLRLKSRVSVTANNLITAARNFASAKGLSPVSLLDAAASHLTAAVVELVRTVKIRPTPTGELDDDGEPTSSIVIPFGASQEPTKTSSIDRSSYVSSVYSHNNSPRASMSQPRSSHGEWQNRPMSSVRQANGRPISSKGGSNGRSSLSTPSNMHFTAHNSDHEDLKACFQHFR